MNRRSPVTVLSTLAVAAAATRLFAASPADGEIERAAARISAASAFQTVETLASPPLEGRLSGTEGFRRASDWVIAEVKKAGLKPVDDLRDYRQPFTHGLGGVEGGTLTLLPAEGEKDGKPYEAELLKDFAPMVNGGGGDVTGEVVFVGYGFNAPAQGRDDYAGVDVKGKVVMALRGEPDSGEWKEHRATIARTKAAARLGAAAFLLVDAPVVSTNVGISRDIPESFLSESFADRLLAGQKLTVAEVRKVMAKGGVSSFATGRRVRLAVKALPWREVTTNNVVAMLPGTDPALRGEYVVVGAHLDHIGLWPRLNPGADDNASGSAALLEVARAAGSMKAKPKRTILFVWFAAEELGLRGAEHFASHPPAGFTKCVAVLNMDMLGVGNGLFVAGGENFPEIKAALEASRDRLAPGYSLKSGKIRGEGRADHAPFFEKGIHAVSLFGSGGEHHGYHTPDDTTYFVTPKSMESGARTVFGAAWALADAKP